MTHLSELRFWVVDPGQHLPPTSAGWILGITLTPITDRKLDLAWELTAVNWPP